MGTNYYAVEAPCPNPCRHCSPGQWHICKSLVSFESHDETPFGPLRSWAEWKDAIRLHGLTIRDEYGVEHSAADFIRDVEATTRENRRRQYEWVVRHGSSKDRDYLDGDGFSFYRGEFS